MTERWVILAVSVCFAVGAGAQEAPAPVAQPVSGETTPDVAPDVVAAEVRPQADLRSGPANLEELKAEVEAFEGAIREYRLDARRLIQFQFEQRKRGIKGRYSKVIDELTEEVRQRRQDAIGRFEEFVGRYPDNAQYTPDALFRLAELHFEKSNDAYVTALEDYDDLMDAFDEGRLSEAPAEPRQDYRRTIELFDRLISRWRDYRNIDGAYYLKGYCLFEMGEDKPALDEFLALVSQHPDSRFVPETWTRIGEYYFDYNQLPEAIAAYRKVIEHKDSPYFDKALYKLAWTHYRNDEYTDAIERFRELIEFSDERAKKTGRASDLRAEAIEYLAISLQEDDWDGDGEPDEGAGFGRVLEYVKGDKAYDVEVLRALVDIFFDNTKYEETIATIRHLHAQFPNNETNPELHAQMITAYERLQRVDDAFAERDKLADSYGEGTDWYAANSSKPKILETAEELMEDALIQAATYHHGRAQDLRARAEQGDVGAEEEALRSYKLAGIGYEKYLAKYPDSENSYQLQYFYAECLYYSFRFVEAAGEYAKVRDAREDGKYREDAAFSAILAREADIRGLIKAGTLSGKPSLTNQAASETEKTVIAEDDNDGTVRVITKEVIPPVVVDLIKERVVYFEKGLNNSDDPTRLPIVIYKIGETYFDYKDFEEARKWFAILIQKYPKQQVTGYAAGNIIETYRQANDWRKMAEWGEIIAAAGLGEGVIDQDEINTLKVGALFKQAERLFAKERYKQAAEEYIRLIEENPDNKYADAAMNNAAVAYEKTRRFESATRTYETLYTKYPDSPFAEGALFRVGINSERFYDYAKAVSSYLRLVQKYPDSEQRADALLNAALLQEQTQQYRAAAVNYERYAKLFPTRKDTAETFFRAAKNYEKLDDSRNQMRIYDQFATRYGNDPKFNGIVIEGMAKKAELYKKRGSSRAARRQYQAIINEFNRRGMQPGTLDAQHPAKAQFELVELEFAPYETLQLRGSLKRQGKIIQQMQKSVQNLNRRYADVLQYKSFGWTLAAFYRLGHVYQLFAEKLYDAPIPEGFSPDEEDLYRTELEDLALPIEDEAVKRFEQAYSKAVEFKITNEWSKRILASLNKYKPSDYPLFKEELPVVATKFVTPSRLLELPKPEESEAPKEPPPAENIDGERSAESPSGEVEDEPKSGEDGK